MALSMLALSVAAVELPKWRLPRFSCRPTFRSFADQYFMLLIVLGSWIVVALCVGMGACIRLRRAPRDLAAAAGPRPRQANLP